MSNFSIRWLRRIVIFAMTAYIGFCIYLCIAQQGILFPAHATKPVPNDWLPTAGVSQTQSFIHGQCGQLHVVIWRADHAKGTIMLFHGNGESVASIDQYAQEFLALGFNLMAWDYPGYGRSTACRFSQEELLEDADASYQWLTQYESANRIFLFGYSIGTGIALSVAAKHTHNPVFLLAAYDSLLNIARERIPSIVPLQTILRYPMETKDWIHKIKAPIYILHGMQDQIIHPQRAQSMLADNVHIAWVAHAGHADHTLFQARNEWLDRLLNHPLERNP